MSINKYSSRSIPIITRDNYYKETAREKSPEWLNDFAKLVEKSTDKNAVQSKREIDLSMQEQISSILGNKHKYSTVEEAINDMKKRTGLTDFLKKAQNELDSKNLFQTMPEIKTFIDNFVEDRPGVAIEAVVHELLKLNPIRDKLPNRNDVPDNIRHYINKKIIEIKNSQPSKTDISNHNLGKTDYSDNTGEDMKSDPLSSLNPTTMD